MSEARLILASRSKARLAMLSAIDLEVEAIPADIDETSIIAEFGNQLEASLTANALQIAKSCALMLASEKALAVVPSITHEANAPYVIGSDQILLFEGKLHEAARIPAQLLSALMSFAGKKHHLVSAAVLYQGSKPIWKGVETAQIHMRPLEPAALRRYVDRYWDDVQGAVGGYHAETSGPLIIQEMKGDPFVIQGLPLLPLVEALIDHGVLKL
ncbi:MAG: Maf family protein [Pseudomonadota bacterium]